MQDYYIIISTILLSLLAIVWRKGDVPNLLIKVFLYSVAMLGSCLSYEVFTRVGGLL